MKNNRRKQAAAKGRNRKEGRLWRPLAFLAGLLSPLRSFASSSLDTVNKAQGFLLDTVTGVGVCFIAFGVISLAISFQSHDDSQRSKAVMAIVGGAIAVSVRFVLDALGVAHQ